MTNIHETVGRARLLLLGGIAYPTLLIAATVLFPMAPGDDLTGAAHPAWLLQHHDTVQLQAYLRTLGAAAGLVMLGGLLALMRRAGAGFGLAGVLAGLGTVAMMGVVGSQAAITAVAMAGASTSTAPATLGALDSLADAFLNLNGVTEGLYYVVIGGSIIGLRIAPRWLGIVGLVIGALTVVSGLASPSNGLETLAMTAMFAVFVWNLLLSGVLLFTTRNRRVAPEGGRLATGVR